MSDPIPPRRRARRPGIRERTESLAEHGQIAELLRTLATTWAGSLFNASEEAKLIRRAITHHTRQGLQATYDAVLMTLLGFNFECLARTQLGLLRRVDELDRQRGGQALSSPPPSIREDLDRLEAIQDGLLDVLKRFATARHTLALSVLDTPMAAQPDPDVSPAENPKIIDFQEAAKAMRRGAR